MWCRRFCPRAGGSWPDRPGALKGLRKDKSVDALLRTLLLHLGCSHSLRETVVRARDATLADLSDVTLLKRLRTLGDWLHAMCVALFREQGIAMSADGGFQVRAFAATTVKEPGRTGALWRLHDSVRLPSLACDFFKLTASEGRDCGEAFAPFPVGTGDYVLADQGYSSAAGLHHVVSSGGHVTVRVNTGSLPLRTIDGTPFDLLAVPGTRVRDLKDAGRHQARAAQAAQGKGKQVQPQTLAFVRYVIVFTTFPEAAFPAAQVPEWYRTCWQVELVFKRFKWLARLGHLPKHDDESARAWLYGKLLVALLVDKLIHHASAVSPWGYRLEAALAEQPLT